MIPRQPSCLFSFCILLVSLSGCSNSDTTPSAETPAVVDASGYDTPDAAFAAMKTAEEEKDFAKFASALTVESQQAMSASMLFVIGMISAFDEDKKDEVMALFAKHGMGPDKQKAPPSPPPENATEAQKLRMVGAMIPDAGAFLSDAMKWLDENADRSEQDGVGTLSDVVVTNDTATGTISKADGTEKPVEFRKLATGWFVHIPDAEFAKLMQPTEGKGEFSTASKFDDFDFHHDAPDELPAQTAMTVAEWQSHWKHSADYEDQPAKKVLEEVAEAAGLSLFDQPDLEEILQQPVTIKLSGVAVLQIIEEVCQQLDIYPRYKLKTVAFQEGVRPHPVAFAGPFLVVAEVDQDEAFPVGHLEYDCFAAGLPTNLVARLAQLKLYTSNDDSSLTVNLSSKEENDGPELIYGNGWGQVKCSLHTCSFSRIRTLKNLLKQVTELPAATGDIVYAIPTQIETLRFVDPKPNDVQESGEVKLTLSRFRGEAGKQSSFRFDVVGVDYNAISVVSKGADGQALKTYHSGGGKFGKKQYFDQNLAPSDFPIKEIEVTIVKSLAQIAHPLEFAAIPLPHFESMPEELTVLSMDGDAPATFEFLKIAKEQHVTNVVMRATNKGNKPIHSCQIKMEYQDAGGKPLKDWPGSTSGQRVLLEVGETKEVNVHAAFMPDETVTVGLTLKQVEFADSEVWTAPKAQP